MKVDISRVKIFVTIPNENVEDVRNAVCQVGAGVIGNYTHCTYSVNGIGTFVPNEDANPHIGNKNKLEFVREEKLEFICEVNKVKDVIKSIRYSHPYEEPAIDIVPLIDETAFD